MQKLLVLVASIIDSRTGQKHETLDCILVSHFNWFARYETNGMLKYKHCPICSCSPK